MRGLRHFIPYLLLLLIGAIGCSTLAAHGAAADSAQNSAIPNEAIRIRIIANSDSDRDQAIKRHVRDEVAKLIDSWGVMPDTIDEARTLIKSRLGEVQKTANRVLKREKAGYGAKTVLAKVDFPVKTFEGKEYPAGKYEALRITLGDGQGANWWCVLFPPLCLTAATAADDQAAAAPAKTSEAGNKQAKNGQDDAGGKSSKAQAAQAASAKKSQEAGGKATGGTQGKPHAKFFLWELLQKLFAFLRALFS